MIDDFRDDVLVLEDGDDTGEDVIVDDLQGSLIRLQKGFVITL